MPKNIWYIKPNGKHGDGFEVELKNGIKEINNNEDTYKFRTCRNKNISLKIKLQQAIDHLKELKENHPSLKNIIILTNIDELDRYKSIETYNNILKLSSFSQDIINKNIIEFKSNIIKEINLTDDEKITLLKIKEISGINAKNISKLPENCGITRNMIPQYCYYTPETTLRGDKFTIDSHPNLDRRQWSTSGSKKISIQKKFEQLLNKLTEIED